MGYYSSLYLSKNSGDSNTKDKTVFNNTLSAPGGKELGGKVIAEPAGGNGASSSGGSYAGGGYSGGGSTGVSGKEENGSSDYMDMYEKYLNAARDEEADRLRAQIRRAINTMEAQKPELKEQFEDSAQSAYIQNMMSKKNLPQQMAAQGLSGGMAESSNVALETAYGNAYNNLQRDYNSGLRQIDADIANIKASGDISLAESANKYTQMLAQAALEQAQQQAATEAAYRQRSAAAAASNQANAARQKAYLDMVNSGDPVAWLKNTGNMAKYDADTYNWLMGQASAMQSAGVLPTAEDPGTAAYNQAFNEMMMSGDPGAWLNNTGNMAKYGPDIAQKLMGFYQNSMNSGVAIPDFANELW